MSQSRKENVQHDTPSLAEEHVLTNAELRSMAQEYSSEGSTLDLPVKRKKSIFRSLMKRIRNNIDSITLYLQPKNWDVLSELARESNNFTVRTSGIKVEYHPLKKKKVHRNLLFLASNPNLAAVAHDFSRSPLRVEYDLPSEDLLNYLKACFDNKKMREELVQFFSERAVMMSDEDGQKVQTCYPQEIIDYLINASLYIGHDHNLFPEPSDRYNLLQLLMDCDQTTLSHFVKSNRNFTEYKHFQSN